jgi:hypothetical protein
MRFSVGLAAAFACFAAPAIVTSPIPVFWGIEKK